MSTDLSGVINDAFQKALSGLISSGKVNELIEAQLQKTISEIISRSFQYGDLRSQLEARVIAAVGIADLDLPSYSATVTEITRRLLESAMQNDIRRGVGKHLEELLAPPPETIKLSKIIELFVQQVKDSSEDSCSCRSSDEIYCRMKEGDVHGFPELWLDEDGDATPKSGFDVDICMTFYKNKLWRVNFKDKFDKGLFAAKSLYGFEKALFAMHQGGTTVEFDCDPEECDLYIGRDH